MLPIHRVRRIFIGSAQRRLLSGLLVARLAAVSTGISSHHQCRPTAPVDTFILFTAPNLSNLVTITLSSPEDYLLWKTQIICLLLSHQLFGMVEGTISIYPATVIDDSVASIPEAQFYEYMRVDQ